MRQIKNEWVLEVIQKLGDYGVISAAAIHGFGLLGEGAVLIEHDKADEPWKLAYISRATFGQMDLDADRWAAIDKAIQEFGQSPREHCIVVASVSLGGGLREIITTSMTIPESREQDIAQWQEKLERAANMNCPAIIIRHSPEVNVLWLNLGAERVIDRETINHLLQRDRGAFERSDLN